MVLYRPGPTASILSGPLQNIQYVNSSRTPYIASRPLRRRRRSDPALLAQSHYATAAKLWRVEGADVRAAWNAAALTLPLPNRLGVRRTLSGFQLWMKHQLVLLTAGLATIEYPPDLNAASPPTDVVLSAAAVAIFSVTNDAAHVGPTYTRLYWAARSYKTQEPRHFNYWRFLAASASTFQSVTLTNEWNAAFGQLVEGEWVAVAVAALPTNALLSPRVSTAALTGVFP